MTVPFTLGDTIGAGFLGCVAAAVLYGITNLQVFMYFLSYPNDWQFQKFSVALLWALDTIHLVLTIQGVYHYLIDSFGNLVAQVNIYWSFKLQIAINVLIIIVVQTLYAIRVWRIAQDNSKIWPCLVILSVVGEYGIGIMLVIKTYQLNTIFDIAKITWEIDLSFAYATYVDVIIAGTICFHLSKSTSGFASTDSKLYRIMKFVVGSGILTSACSLTALFFFVGMPGTLVFIGIEFLLTKLYINSFMAMLNARKSIQKENVVASTLGGPSQRVVLSHGNADDKDNIPPLSSRSGLKKGRHPQESQELMAITVHRQVDIRADSLYSR